jgi:uncharacterized protein YecE (DUF72 family)
MDSSSNSLRAVHVGCAGWNYRDWRPWPYPPGLPSDRWLGRYAELFDTVEVNATFYRLVSREAVLRWVEQTPGHFHFAVKASRYLTHIKRLREMREGIARFCERIEPLARAGRLSAVLWQLPESFQRDDELLATALHQLPPGRHAFEFRHPSWFAPEVYALLRTRDCALVLGDHPGRRFQSHDATARWRYVRLHFGSRGRRGNYSRLELEEWARRLHAWRAQQELLVYFNNDWEAFAPRNAATLRLLLRGLAAEPTSVG